MTQDQKDYNQQAQERWGDTPEYAEFSQKDAHRTDVQREELAVQMMGIFSRLGACKELSPDDQKPQTLVRELQNFISAHYYQCSNEILASLGQLYGCGGEFTKNINAAAGEGAAEYAARAIHRYCESR